MPPLMPLDLYQRAITRAWLKRTDGEHADRAPRRAMLENVADALPEYRHPSLETQLRLLDCTIESAFSYPEDRALARLADVRGLGGSPPPRDNGS